MQGQIQRTLCTHGHPPTRCETEGCPNRDARTPLDKCFSRNPNGVFAAKLFKENQELYQELKRQAQEKGMLTFGVVPAALRD
jgi:hypothetical protein